MLVTEYRKLPFIISETKPESNVTSGENAPANAPTTLNPDGFVVPMRETPDRRVDAKSGNKNKINETLKTKKDNTLNVSDAAARFCVVSVIVLLLQVIFDTMRV
jgi:hypothetical protein